jgi:hypothetical protein
MTVYGIEGGLKSIVASCSNDAHSFKFVLVEPLRATGAHSRVSQVQEVGC